MALITCPECGQKVSTSAAACPGCGHPLAGSAQVLPTQPDSSTSESTNTIPENPLIPQINALGGLFAEREAHLWLYDASVGHLREVLALCEGHVTSIEMNGEASHDRHLEVLQRFSYFSKLELVICDRLTDESMVYVSRMKQLKELRLNMMLCGEEFTMAGLRALARMDGLELLKLPSYVGGSSIIRVDDSLVSYLQQSLANAVIVKCKVGS